MIDDDESKIHIAPLLILRKRKRWHVTRSIYMKISKLILAKSIHFRRTFFDEEIYIIELGISRIISLWIREKLLKKLLSKTGNVGKEKPSI